MNIVINLFSYHILHEFSQNFAFSIGSLQLHFELAFAGGGVLEVAGGNGDEEIAVERVIEVQHLSAHRVHPALYHLSHLVQAPPVRPHREHLRRRGQIAHPLRRILLTLVQLIQRHEITLLEGSSGLVEDVALLLEGPIDRGLVAWSQNPPQGFLSHQAGIVLGPAGFRAHHILKAQLVRLYAQLFLELVTSQFEDRFQRDLLQLLLGFGIVLKLFLILNSIVKCEIWSALERLCLLLVDLSCMMVTLAVLSIIGLFQFSVSSCRVTFFLRTLLDCGCFIFCSSLISHIQSCSSRQWRDLALAMLLVLLIALLQIYLFDLKLSRNVRTAYSYLMRQSLCLTISSNSMIFTRYQWIFADQKQQQKSLSVCTLNYFALFSVCMALFIVTLLHTDFRTISQCLGAFPASSHFWLQIDSRMVYLFYAYLRFDYELSNIFCSSEVSSDFDLYFLSSLISSNSFSLFRFSTISKFCIFSCILAPLLSSV